MTYIDYISLANAEKAITIMYIISITLVNFALVVTVVKKGQFLYRPNSLTLVSMAFGDLFYALFPLVINAILMFGDLRTASSLSCNTLLSSLVYQSWMIHFVYGTGLIVLSAELVYRYKKNQKVEATQKNIIVSLLVSSLPWILSLIIVLPVSMSGSDCSGYGNVIDPPRIRASFGVCVILPTIAAILACGMVKFSTKLLPVQYNIHTVAHPVGGPNIAVTALNSTSQTIQQVPRSYPQSIALQTAGDRPQQGPTEQETQYETLDEWSRKVTVPPHNVSAFPPQSNSYQSPQNNPGFSPQQNPYQPTVYDPALQTSVDQTATLPDPTREKNLLLIIAVISFFCVVPYAIYMMGITGPRYSLEGAYIIVMDCLSWWSTLRSLITPIIFRQHYKN